MFVKTKDEIFDRIREYLNLIRVRWDRFPKILRVDNGSEFINKRVKDYLRELGIKLQTTAPYSLSQHGIAKRFNRTLIELAHTMLNAKNLPQCLWEHAVAHAAYLQNRAPTRALKGKTPHEA